MAALLMLYCKICACLGCCPTWMTLHWTTRFRVTTSSIFVPSASCSKSFWTSGRSHTRSVAGIEHTTTFRTSLCAHFFRFFFFCSTAWKFHCDRTVRQLGTILFVSDTKGRTSITIEATRQLSTTSTAGRLRHSAWSESGWVLPGGGGLGSKFYKHCS